MYCPEHLIFNTSVIDVWFYDSTDRRWETIPLSLKLNPLRYQLTFKFRKKYYFINKEGRWNVIQKYYMRSIKCKLFDGGHKPNCIVKQDGGMRYCTVCFKDIKE